MKTESKVLISDIIQKVFWIFVLGKVEEDAKEKGCFNAVDLKSAFRSNELAN